MFAFGTMGYLMRKFDYPAAPLLLALVLGPIMEKNLKLSLKMSQGSIAIFFQRPITLILIALIVFSLVWPFLVSRFSKGKQALELPVVDE
jgi:putative tricarboxylic transport membrane protein